MTLLIEIERKQKKNDNTFKPLNAKIFAIEMNRWPQIRNMIITKKYDFMKEKFQKFNKRRVCWENYLVFYK